jgi:hypothetical protein
LIAWGRDVLQPERVAVRRRLGHQFAGDGGAGAGLVLHDHVLADLAGHLGREGARQHVGDASRCEADQHADRLPGVVHLRGCRRGDKEGEAAGGGAGQEPDENDFHRGLLQGERACCMRANSFEARIRQL